MIKRILSLIASALPHINIALGITMLALLVTDQFNRAMNFINNDMTKTLMIIYCVLIIIQSVIYSYNRRNKIE